MRKFSCRISLSITCVDRTNFTEVDAIVAGTLLRPTTVIYISQKLVVSTISYELKSIVASLCRKWSTLVVEDKLILIFIL